MIHQVATESTEEIDEVFWGANRHGPRVPGRLVKDEFLSANDSSA